MSCLVMKTVSSLTKVFLDREPLESHVYIEGFKNEVLSFQIAYTLKEPMITRMHVQLKVVSPIREAVRVRQVEHVPVRYAAPLDSDANYLRKTPGLYPDMLREISAYSLRVRNGQWDSLWVEIDPALCDQTGEFPVTLILTAEDGTYAEKTQWIKVLNAELPEQKLIHTKWLHTDCLAEYYGHEVFGEAHWKTIEKFVRKAVNSGINMVLMPVHTLPLDTRVGGERLTTQLVEVAVENGKYYFDTRKMKKWIAMCKRCGVKYYEMAHLYTQWGALHAPKIMGTKDGKYQKLFGWETDATGEEYRAFLAEYIPELRKVLKEEGIEERTYWHISDEPSGEQLKDYQAAKEQVASLLDGCIIMDALSNYAFYQQGIVEHPVVANDHVQRFIDEGTEDLWTYYCCGQYKDVSNMFIAMPSARNRIIAAQLFKYRIKGFLQWGYNFYSAQYSDYKINPFMTTDADGFVPAGDPFQVYPGEDGEPIESLRMAVTRDAMQDLRAFEMLASLEGEDAVVQLIDEGLDQKITFAEYPKEDEYLLQLRKKVNAAIMRHIERTQNLF